MKKLLSAVILGLTFSTSTALATTTLQLPISYENQQIGTLTNFQIEGDSSDSSRLLISLSAEFNSFGTNLDRILGARGNFGSCTKRLYWTGNTSILRSTKSAMQLRSRARFELWYCDDFFGSGRLLQDTKTLNWLAYIEPSSINDLHLVARIQNIRNFPNWIEKWIGELERKIRIPIPISCGSCNCTDMFESLNARLSSITFAHEDQAVQMNAVFSISGNLTVALRCL